MITSQSHSSTIVSRRCSTICQPLPTTIAPLLPAPSPPPNNRFLWKVRLRSVARERLTALEFDAQQFIDFLFRDTPHLFDDQGIDASAYDHQVKFRDPITKFDSLSGYLFNIAMLKVLFNPHFQLHWAKQTGAYEITTRWTTVMKFVLLPWKPELVFTGTSVMCINPQTMKFCSHVDYWDSVENNDYFSVEGLMDVVKQIYKTPELETPKYQTLKRTAKYEVRKYDPFMVIETSGEKFSGSSGFNYVAGCIFGKNSAGVKIPMTTPVFTRPLDPEISIQIVLPSEKDLDSLPAPNEAEISLRKVEGSMAAVSKFSGKPTEYIVREKEKLLRQNLARDGLRAKEGCLLACYSDPGSTWSFIMRNEVLLWLEEFSLDSS